MPLNCAADVRYPLGDHDWDMRRREARDATKIIAETLAMMGCTAADLTAAEMVEIITLATNTVELDRLNAQRLRGKLIDPNLHGTAQNSYRRSRDAVRALERRVAKRLRGARR